MLSEAADTLRRNAEQCLHDRSTDQQISLIEELISIWSDDMFPLRCELLNKCDQKQIHFSREIFSHGLDEIFKCFSRERLYHLLKVELGSEKSLDGWYRHLKSEDAPAHASHRFSLRLVGAHYRQCVPGQLLIFMIKALIAKTAFWVICSDETLEIARLFAHSIYQVDPKVARCIEILSEQQVANLKEDFKRECDYYREWNFNLRKPMGKARHFGFEWVSEDYVRQNGIRKLVCELAKDITAWDQFYPNAPHVVFVEQNQEHYAMQIPEKLMEELEHLNVGFPQAYYTPESMKLSKFLQYAYRTRSKASSDTLVLSSNDGNENDEDPGCTVVYEEETKFSNSNGNRFVFVKPAPKLPELLRLIESHRNQIGCVGLSVTPEEAPVVARHLAAWGIPRICGTGMMHRPCLFHEGDVPSMDELTYKSFWERSYHA